MSSPNYIWYISVNLTKCKVLIDPCSLTEYSLCFSDLLQQMAFQFRPQLQNRENALLGQRQEPSSDERKSSSKIKDLRLAGFERLTSRIKSCYNSSRVFL